MRESLGQRRGIGLVCLGRGGRHCGRHGRERGVETSIHRGLDIALVGECLDDATRAPEVEASLH
jgi:hypothetical protein